MKKLIIVTVTILAISLYGGLSNVHALEIGDTFAFSDTVGSITIGDPTTTWTHILDLDDFIPNLSGTEALKITSANLIIEDMDYSYESIGGVGMYFSVLTLDGYYLDRYWESGTSGEAGPLSWSIDIPNEVMLNLIADKEVQIQLTATAGTLNSIGSATLQGSGVAVVPEPGILSLVMFGLAGMPFIGPMIRRRRKI